MGLAQIRRRQRSAGSAEEGVVHYARGQHRTQQRKDRDDPTMRALLAGGQAGHQPLGEAVVRGAIETLSLVIALARSRCNAIALGSSVAAAVSSRAMPPKAGLAVARRLQERRVGNSVQPGGEACVRAKLAQLAPCDQESLLRQIVGPRTVASRKLP
jgi:hypothetical protein